MSTHAIVHKFSLDSHLCGLSRLSPMEKQLVGTPSRSMQTQTNSSLRFGNTSLKLIYSVKNKVILKSPSILKTPIIISRDYLPTLEKLSHVSHLDAPVTQNIGGFIIGDRSVEVSCSY